MDDVTVTPNEPKFIMHGTDCFYCFGNCDLCKIRFMCWSGTLDFTHSEYAKELGIVHGYDFDDVHIEQEAFGNVLGRIIRYASVRGGKFTMHPYRGWQTRAPVFVNSSLLYLNDKGMVCC